MDKLIQILTQKAIFGGFCEKQNNFFPVETWNSISNAGYLLIAILLSRIQTNDKIYNILLYIVGISSFLYHSLFIRIFQVLDLSSICLIVSYIFLKLLNISSKKNILFSIIIFLATILLNLSYPDFGRSLVYIFVIPTIFLIAIRYKKDSILPIFIFFLAFIAWKLDSNLLCFEQFPYFDGHVIWHLLTAIGFYRVGLLLQTNFQQKR